MCTVTYISTPNGFVFTSNRDEINSRSTHQLSNEKTLAGELLYFPKEPLANGTWFAFTPTKLVCLLNGGFHKHERILPYRKSRGLIVLDRFKEIEFTDFAEKIDLENIEPFTLISVETNHGVILTEMIWDGENKWVNQKNSQMNHIWSSSTLYSEEIKTKRNTLFRSFKPKNAEEVMEFHQNYGHEFGHENKFKMFRENGPETISTTQLEKVNNELKFCHLDYTNFTRISKEIRIPSMNRLKNYL